MKQVHANYTFVAATKTITLTGLNIAQDQLLLITNATRGIIYYNFASSSHRAVVTAGANTTVVLTDASTTGHADSDQLTIHYDDQLTTQTIAGTVTASILSDLNDYAANYSDAWPIKPSDGIAVPISGTVTASVGDGGSPASLASGKIAWTPGESYPVLNAVRLGFAGEELYNGVGLDSGGAPLPVKLYTSSDSNSGIGSGNPLPVSGTVTANVVGQDELGSAQPLPLIETDGGNNVTREMAVSATIVDNDGNSIFNNGEGTLGIPIAARRLGIPAAIDYITAENNRLDTNVKNSVTIGSLPAISGTVGLQNYTVIASGTLAPGSSSNATFSLASVNDGELVVLSATLGGSGPPVYGLTQGTLGQGDIAVPVTQLITQQTTTIFSGPVLAGFIKTREQNNLNLKRLSGSIDAGGGSWEIRRYQNPAYLYPQPVTANLASNAFSPEKSNIASDDGGPQPYYGVQLGCFNAAKNEYALITDTNPLPAADYGAFIVSESVGAQNNGTFLNISQYPTGTLFQVEIYASAGSAVRKFEYRDAANQYPAGDIVLTKAYDNSSTLTNFGGNDGVGTGVWVFRKSQADHFRASFVSGQGTNAITYKILAFSNPNRGFNQTVDVAQSKDFGANGAPTSGLGLGWYDQSDDEFKVVSNLNRLPANIETEKNLFEPGNPTPILAVEARIGFGQGSDLNRISVNQGLPVNVVQGSVTALGATTDASASSDTGTFSLISLFKRLLGTKLPDASSGRVPVILAPTFGSFTNTGGVSSAIDCAGYDYLVQHISGGGGGHTRPIQWSNDNTNWFSGGSVFQYSQGGTGAYSDSSWVNLGNLLGTSSGIFVIPVLGRYWRITTGSAGGGSWTHYWYLHKGPFPGLLEDSVGGKSQPAATSDTDSTVGFMGLFKRLLQRITTLIPANLTVSSTRLLVDGSGVTQPVYVDGGYLDTAVEANVTGSVVAHFPNGTVTNRSSTITTGGTSQQVAAYNANRKYFLIQNTSDTDMYLGVGYTPTSSTGILLAKSGGGITFESGFIPTLAINVLCATTGKAFVALEG